MYTREKKRKREQGRKRGRERTCNLTVVKGTQVKNVTKKGVGGTERKKNLKFLLSA